jgi:type II secretory pathway pseudopilin PulG
MNQSADQTAARLRCVPFTGRRAVVARRGLTIVEVIVVCIIIALLAGLVVPRLGNLSARRAEVEARGLTALLSAAAQRDAMSSQAYAVAFDPGSSTVTLLAYREADDPAQQGGWTPAPWQPALMLAEAEIRGIAVDGQPIGTPSTGSSVSAWRAEFRPSQPRPRVSVLLTARAAPDQYAWQVDLGSTQAMAVLKPLASAAAWAPGDPELVDLDAQGMREEPW